MIICIYLFRIFISVNQVQYLHLNNYNMTIPNLALVEGVLKLDLTDSEYRSLEATSYSDMLEFERYESGSFGRTYNLASKIGVQFHHAILNPSDNSDALKGAALPMYQKLISAPFFQKYLRESEKNVTYVNLSPSGMLVKGRVDMVHNGMAIDLVSTKAESLSEFLMLYKKLQYSRKAAFYLSLTELESFLFVGVQRHAPYNVYTIQCGKNSKVLLADSIQEADLKNNHFLGKLKCFMKKQLQSA